MVRRTGWHRLLLMLSLIVGVVTMHSAVACHAAGIASPGPSVQATAMGDSSPADSSSISADLARGHGAGPMGGGHASVAVAGSAQPVEAMSDGSTSQHGSAQHDPLSALHDLLHLCLAVVTALLVLAAAVLLAILAVTSARPDPPTGAGRPVAGPRAPPPTSIRLAQLCVLRN